MVKKRFKAGEKSKLLRQATKNYCFNKKNDLLKMIIVNLILILYIELFQVEQFTVLWLLFIIIVAGNLGVIYTLAVGRSRKSRMNYFITHLALAGEQFL